MSESTRVPRYRKHKQSGQAIVTLPDGLGGRRDVLLGKHGTEVSRHEYARVISEWETNGRRSVESSSAGRHVTINELILTFWPHVEQHYRRPDGSQTQEVNDFKLSLRPLRELYGHTLAREFGPLALKTVRKRMIEVNLCRNVINARIGRIRRMFKWAVGNEIVPPSVLQGLQAVGGLQRGRSAARETEPVKPVSEACVRATLPFLLPQVAALVQLQLHCGMRPGEVCVMRAIDIDMSGKVWLYRPGSDQGPHGAHKTAYRGLSRVIPIGPRGQAIIRQWLKPDLYAYLFSPREAMAIFRERQRKQRKSKVQPSQQNRRKRKPRKGPGDRYGVPAYGQAVRKACLKACVPHWHPNQLRHTKATELRREAGIDAARVVLGHRSPAITETYAELDINRAIQVMERLG